MKAMHLKKSEWLNMFAGIAFQNNVWRKRHALDAITTDIHRRIDESPGLGTFLAMRAPIQEEPR